MKKQMRMLVVFGLFLSLLLLAGCTKDTDDPIVVGQPTGSITYSIVTTDAKSATVAVHVEWTTENAKKGTLDGSRISLPNGDTTLTMKKGDKKTLLFRIENASGKFFQEYLKISIPLDPSPPTGTASFTFNDQSVDTLPYLVGAVKIKVIFANGFLYLNGVKYENSPATFNFNISETKTYDFKVVGPGGEITLPFIVPVYVPTEQELLISDPKGWICDYAEGSYTIDGEREPAPLLDGIIYFSLSPKNCKYVYPCISVSGTCTNEDSWGINDQTITLGSDNEFVEVLSSNKMVWRDKGSSTSGATYYTWKHFVHPSNP
jgi:hypothetical protein